MPRGRPPGKMGVLYYTGTSAYQISGEATALFKHLTRDAPRFHKYWADLNKAPRNLRPLVEAWLILGPERFGCSIDCRFIDAKYITTYRVIRNQNYSESVQLNHDRYLTQQTAKILKENKPDAIDKLRALYKAEYKPDNTWQRQQQQRQAEFARRFWKTA